MPYAVAYLSYVLFSYAMILTVIKAEGAVKWIQKGIKNHPLIRKVFNIPLVSMIVLAMAFYIIGRTTSQIKKREE